MLIFLFIFIFFFSDLPNVLFSLNAHFNLDLSSYTHSSPVHFYFRSALNVIKYETNVVLLHTNIPNITTLVPSSTFSLPFSIAFNIYSHTCFSILSICRSHHNFPLQSSLTPCLVCVQRRCVEICCIMPYLSKCAKYTYFRLNLIFSCTNTTHLVHT